MGRPKKAESISTSTVSSATTSISSSSTSSSSSTDESASSTGLSRKPIMMKLNNNDSDRLQLAQAVNNLCVKGEAIIAAMQDLSMFDKEKIQSIDMQLESKKKEYADTTSSLSEQYEQLSKQLENNYADLQIKLSQQLREFKLDAAQKVLKEFNMVSIESHRYVEMQDELQELRVSSADALQKAVKEAESRCHQERVAQINNLQLEHKAAVASVNAQVEQQVKEISVLRETIAGLKHELAEQRQLTKEVAQASSKAQISQSFAK